MTKNVSALILSVSLLACASKVRASQLIAWNVGQGQWVTWLETDACLHFDLGGEHAPWRKIREACGDKRNIAYFSHWDWDHIGFARQAARSLPRFCVEKLPAGPATPRAHKQIDDIPICDESVLSQAQEQEVLEVNARRADNEPNNDGKKGRNDSSRVFEIDHEALVPGDSTAQQEFSWRMRLKANALVKTLILGHHGSQTSTSRQLLASLPKLRQAIASARYARYGHPHRAVVLKLKERGVALLKTEDWGTIRIETKNRSPSLHATQAPVLLRPTVEGRITSDRSTALSERSTDGIPCSSCGRRVHK